MANTYLTRTPSSAGNRKKFTISFWVKRSGLSSNGNIFSATNNASGSNERFYVLFGSGDTLSFKQYDGSNTNFDLTTNRKFRDTNCWYHIFYVFNSYDGTPNNRQRLWVNGVEETSFSSRTNPGGNADSFVNQTKPHNIGNDTNVGSRFFNGLISHFHFIDGTTPAYTEFGSTDATTGEWKIKTPTPESDVYYGTNGFFILKDGNSVTDQSGKGNNLTVGGGTLTKTEDCPSNIFATGNRLNVNSGGVGTFQYGNNDITVNGASGSQFGSSSTLGMTTGKFYCEAKIITVDSTMIGVSPSPSEDARNDRSPSGGSSSGAVGCLVETGNKYVSGNGTTYGAATSANGIMMIALDLDNLKVYFGSGGQWSNGSGAWNQSGLTSGAALSLTAVASTAEGAYFFSFGDGGGSATGRVQWNFGNGYFGTTAVSSAGTNASGIGIFEYDVPTGYTALSTKGLNL